MATIFEGERLLKEFLVEKIGITPAGDAYEVPASRYSKINIQILRFFVGGPDKGIEITGSDGNTVVYDLLSIVVGAVSMDILNGSMSIPEFILDAGQKIRIIGGFNRNDSRLIFNVREYERKDT